MVTYVDDMYLYSLGQFKRGPRTYKMSHMIADTPEELHAMADKIGLSRRYYQGDHYDVAMVTRAKAVAAGAVEITLKQCACMDALRRRGEPMGDPATAIERRMSLRKTPRAAFWYGEAA